MDDGGLIRLRAQETLQQMMKRIEGAWFSARSMKALYRSLSIVFSVCNEEENIFPLLNVMPTITALQRDFEIILVDDWSPQTLANVSWVPRL